MQPPPFQPPPFLPGMLPPPFAAFSGVLSYPKVRIEQQNTMMHGTGYHLACSILHDILGEKRTEYLRTVEIRLVELIPGPLETKTQISMMLDALGVQYQPLKSDLLSQLLPHQVLIISSYDTFHLPQDTAQYLLNFLKEGGCLITFGVSLKVLEAMFPSLIGVDRHDFLPNECVMTSFAPEAAFIKDFCFKRIGMLQFRHEPDAAWIKIHDKDRVLPLVSVKQKHEKTGSSIPIIVKIPYELGVAYHFCSPFGIRREEDPLKWFERRNAGPLPQRIWECAAEHGKHDAMAVSVTSYPFLWLFAEVLIQHKERFVPQDS